MRFDSLKIPAFGPFTSCSLEFKNSQPDLHVIYGANEAGKSSLLRAIHNLLYGIPNSTADSFLHDYKKLRVGATVSDGENQLTFQRRKGYRGTLLDAEQNTIDEGKLKAFCGSVNDEFFSHMFGLSTENLRTGAANLLSGEGELGTLLFSASLGGSPVDAAIEKLQIEADLLFAGNGRKANTIVKAYSKFKDLEKQSREHSTSANDWNKLKETISAAQENFNKKDSELTDKRRRETRVRNLIQAIPLMKQRKAASDELAEIALPNLPSDFPDRVRGAQKLMSEAKALIRVHRSSLDSKSERLESIDPFQRIVDDAPALDSLHKGITQHLEDIGDHESNQDELRQLRNDQDEQLQSLQLSDPETLASLPNPGTGELARITEIAGTLESAELTCKQALKDLKQTRRKRKNLKTKLANRTDTEITLAIRDLESRVEDHNQNNKVAATWIEDRDQLGLELRQITRELGVAEIDADVVRELQVPSLTVLQEYDKERTVLMKDQTDYQKQLDELDSGILDKGSEITRASGDISVVTRDDLIRSREERDQKWLQLAEKLKDRTGVDAKEPRVLTDKIRRSDDVADVLRDHAETLGKLASLNHDLEFSEDKRGHASKILGRISRSLHDWQDRWSERSSFLADREFLPSELIEWRDKWETWCGVDGKLSLLNNKMEDHRDKESALRGELRQNFGERDASYAALCKQLAGTLRKAESVKGERKAISEEIDSLQSRQDDQGDVLTDAEETLSSERKKWTESIAGLQVDRDDARKTTLRLLEARRDAHTTNQQIADASDGLDRLMQRIDDYRSRLEEHRKRHLPDSPEFDPAHPDLAEGRLAELLSSAKDRQSKYKGLESDIADLEGTLAAEQKALEAAEEEIENLLAEAQLASEDNLPEAIAQLENRSNLTEKLRMTNDTLGTLAGSSSIEELIEQAEGEDRDVLEAELPSLSADIKAYEQKRDAARDSLNDEVKRRAELEEAKDEAANAKQLAANELSKVVTNSERYIRLQHAIAFLKSQVEAYRKKSQGPMVQRTSGFFRTLTNGSFAGVAAQADDNDSGRINLVALRPDPNDPDGFSETLATRALSEGTRDQLYLALRLAAIDIHLENHASMPLILDDILMTFDDERAKSVFKLLTALSAKTQVIIFTHHQHTAAMAKNFVPHDHILNLSLDGTVTYQENAESGI